MTEIQEGPFEGTVWLWKHAVLKDLWMLWLDSRNNVVSAVDEADSKWDRIQGATNIRLIRL